jgi:hypothetical protein
LKGHAAATPIIISEAPNVMRHLRLQPRPMAGVSPTVSSFVPVLWTFRPLAHFAIDKYVKFCILYKILRPQWAGLPVPACPELARPELVEGVEGNPAVLAVYPPWRGDSERRIFT